MAITPQVQAAINSCALRMQQVMTDTASATAWNRTLTGHTNATGLALPVGYYKQKLTRLCTIMTNNGCNAADVATLQAAWGA